MDQKVQQLLDAIGNFRKELHECADDKSLTDPEVVAMSQALDALLNEYYRLILRKNGG